MIFDCDGVLVDTEPVSNRVMAEAIREDRFTIADITLYAYTHVASEGGFDLDSYPAIRSWLERVAAQPGMIPITA